MGEERKREWKEDRYERETKTDTKEGVGKSAERHPHPLVHFEISTKEMEETSPLLNATRDCFR